MAVLASVFVHLGIKRKLEHSLPDQKQPQSRGSTFSIPSPSRTLGTPDTDPPSSHSAELGGQLHCFGDISGSFSRKPPRSAIVLLKLAVSSSPAQPVISESPYADLKPIHFSAVLDRVAGIAPAPLLPGEQEAEYATHVARIVAAAQPRDAIEDLLTRDVIDLSWDVLRLRRLKAGLLRGAISSSIYQVMCRLGYEDEYAWKLTANWAAERKAAQKKVAARASEGATDDGRRDGRDARGQDRLI